MKDTSITAVLAALFLFSSSRRRLSTSPESTFLRHAGSSGADATQPAFDRLARADCRKQLVAAELAADSALGVSSDPPGAEVRLYRLVEQSKLLPEGEPRVVPVPLGEELGAAPFVAYDAQLTLVFLPTSYGTIEPTIAQT